MSFVLRPKFNPNLSQKGLILVVIPLFVQLVASLCLSELLNRAEEQGHRVDRSRQVTSDALRIATELYDAEFAMYDYVDYVFQNQQGSPRLSKAFEAKARVLPYRIKQLKRLAKGSEKERMIVQNYCASVVDLLQLLLLDLKPTLDSGNIQGGFALGALMAYNSKFLPAVGQHLKDLVEYEKKDSALHTQVAEKRELARSGLIFFLLLDVFVVCMLLIYFNRGAVARFAVLTDNTLRFARQEKLNPPLSGSDEFAGLDRVFHEMADAMEKSKKREAELLQMKKEIMAMVSHDLRSPLNSLQLVLQMLKSNSYGVLNEQGMNRVEASGESVSRLIRMINDLLDLEKLEAGKLELELRDLPIQVLIERSVEALEALASSKNIEINYQDNGLEIKGDGDRIIQVITNILSNAIKFSPENSEIDIESKLLAAYVEIRIKDRGPGIPPEFREQIFDRYSQLRSEMSAKGSGLGLAICRLIIEMHGGSVGVDELEGGGSAFWFKVPAVTD